ncbi:MAG: hypothetical protein E7231_03210 [Cellulosilyticum sp.]|nr:hypothetical protein [Cellulosilyticum sp.]
MAKHVKNFIYKDKNLFSMLARTNVATKEQVETFMGIRRAESHIKDGLIEKAILVIKDSGEEARTIEVYRLTEEGKGVVRERCNISSMYASNSVRHDLALTHSYIELFNRDSSLVDRWVTENDYKVMLQERVLELREAGRDREADQMEADIERKRYSAPDGGYRDAEGRIHSIEITTRYYKEETIVAKANTIQALGITSCNEIYIN